MLAAAENLEFERAAQLRDRIVELQQQQGQTDDVEQTPGFAATSKPKGKRRRGRRGGRGGSRSSRRVPKPERP